MEDPSDLLVPSHSFLLIPSYVRSIDLARGFLVNLNLPTVVEESKVVQFDVSLGSKASILLPLVTVVQGTLDRSSVPVSRGQRRLQQRIALRMKWWCRRKEEVTVGTTLTTRDQLKLVSPFRMNRVRDHSLHSILLCIHLSSLELLYHNLYSHSQY